MKKEVSPVVAIVVIVILVVIAVFFIVRKTGVSQTQEAPTGMPPEVAAEFEKRLGGVTGPGVETAGDANMPPPIPSTPEPEGE